MPPAVLHNSVDKAHLRLDRVVSFGPLELAAGHVKQSASAAARVSRADSALQRLSTAAGVQAEACRAKLVRAMTYSEGAAAELGDTRARLHDAERTADTTGDEMGRMRTEHELAAREWDMDMQALTAACDAMAISEQGLVSARDEMARRWTHARDELRAHKDRVRESYAAWQKQKQKLEGELCERRREALALGRGVATRDATIERLRTDIRALAAVASRR